MPFTNRPSDKRSKVLSATLALLAAEGFHGFSVKQLAEKAGVATGTVYLYFKDREDLIRELYIEVVHEVASHMFVAVDATDSLLEQYRQICRNFWHFCLKNPDIVSCKAQFDHLPPDIRRVQKVESREIIHPLYALFEAGRENAVLKPLPDDVLVSLALEPLFDLAGKQLIGLVTLADTDVEQVISACWDGLSLQPKC
ncbi:MAG: TetR/AcrR family transcriptional regulator [Pseudomonadales bacterium]|nr:TetR/AcrR family transcriptional regulator [Pseudomonadales bacterium]